MKREKRLTFFAFLSDGLGLFAAAVALFQRHTARALIGGSVAFGPGALGVSASYSTRKK